ncbi:serine/threonine protein kinase [Acidobacteriota bacterium]
MAPASIHQSIPALDEGMEVGRYVILREIGRGAMGRVFLARDPIIDRHVALKVIHLGVGLDEKDRIQFYGRFLTEARAAGKLQHVGIVMVYDVGHDDQHSLAYIALEYIDGPSLAKLLRMRKFSMDDTVRLCKHLLQAMRYAHSQGVIHRDIKPGNVLLTKKGQPKITDFGIAKLSDTNLTAEGTLLGSPDYMSPEQATGRQVTKLTDIFSLGVVMYEMLAERKAFPGKSIPEVLYQVVHNEPPDLHSLNQAIPESLSKVVFQAIRKDPGERFSNAAGMLQALNSAYQTGSKPKPIFKQEKAPEVEPPITSDDTQEILQNDVQKKPPERPAPSPVKRLSQTPTPRWQWITLAALAVVLVSLSIPKLLSLAASKPPAQVSQVAAVTPDEPELIEGPVTAVLLRNDQTTDYPDAVKVPDPSRNQADQAIEDNGSTEQPGADNTPEVTKTAGPTPPPHRTPKTKPPKQDSGSSRSSNGSTGSPIIDTPSSDDPEIEPDQNVSPPEPVSAVQTVFPFSVGATHPHKFGKCYGVAVFHEDRIKFSSSDHQEPLVIDRENIKHAHYDRDTRVLNITLTKKSIKSFGRAKKQKFILEEPLPSSVQDALPSKTD